MRVVYILVVLSLAFYGCKDKPTQTVKPAEKKVEISTAGFAVLPVRAENPANPLSPEKIELGEKLYFEKKLSLAQDISCNSCHDLANWGVDSKPTSPGHKGQLGDRNSPTVYNSALHFAQFWDGRAADVEAQAIGPILNPVEMAMPSEGEVLARLSSDPEYPGMFEKAFPDEENPLTYKNVGNAIGAFERTLILPDRFDAFINGDHSALTAEEIAGFETFKSVGCTACHMGSLLGGTMYQKLGLVVPYETEDTGRHKETASEADMYFFKVPSLRNIEKTGPYFHDGSIAELSDAVRLMGKHQLGRDLTQEQIESIVAFLNALTAELPEEYAAKN